MKTFFLFLMLASAGCATTYSRPIPVVDNSLPGHRVGNYIEALASCEAATASLVSAEQQASSTAMAGAIFGALAGAALGQATGAGAGYGAGVGAASGGFGGLGAGYAQGASQLQIAMSRCLAGRGYTVLGWR